MVASSHSESCAAGSAGGRPGSPSRASTLSYSPPGQRHHEAPHQPGNMIGGQPGLRIDQIPRQLRTIGPTRALPRHGQLRPSCPNPANRSLTQGIKPPPGGGIYSQARRRGPTQLSEHDHSGFVATHIRRMSSSSCAAITLETKLRSAQDAAKVAPISSQITGTSGELLDLPPPLLERLRRCRFGRYWSRARLLRPRRRACRNEQAWPR